MATVTILDAVTPTAGDFSCCRCRELIVLDDASGASETWVTATEGDPWCQGLAHLPGPVAC